MTTGTALAGMETPIKTTSSRLASLSATLSPAKIMGALPTVKMQVGMDEESGDIVIRFPQRIPVQAIRESKTDKKTPFVYLHPQNADGTPGSVVVPVVIYENVNTGTVDAEGNVIWDEQETVLGLRLGGINAFVTGAR